MGRKRATKLFLAQPIRDAYHMEQLLEGQVDLSTLLPWFDFSI